MRIFKNRWFAKFAKAEKIHDAKLCQTVHDAEKGLIDADYGGGVIKQRIARPNEGKSGGYRTIILYRQENKAFFVYGFAKHSRKIHQQNRGTGIQAVGETHVFPIRRRS